MKNFEIEWQYCLPVWLGHTFPSSVKRGVVEVQAKNKQNAIVKFREMGHPETGEPGYYRINQITVKDN